MAATAQLKLLVTSREHLHLRGEHEVAVPPLALPDPATSPALDQLTAFAAVALFIQRAQAVQPAFQLTSANAPAIAAICTQLDGLPLAIELAAARVKLFAPDALLARLDNRLALLTGGQRDLPARQQTIRQTISWSYELLNDAEQTLFRRLGVFVGGCTLEAAQEVCASSGQDELATLESLAALVDKSLLRQIAAPDGPRFTLLETIRARVRAGAAGSERRGGAATRTARPLLPHAGRAGVASSTLGAHRGDDSPRSRIR